MSSALTLEIAAAAARIVVEEGAEYGAAKRRAAKVLGRGAVKPAMWPDNDLLEDEIRRYLALYCSDTQPAELRALRELALIWMQRLAAFRPYVCGAVWRGTATSLSAIHLELYADDCKAAELELINRNCSYEVGSITGPDGRTVDQLLIEAPCASLGLRVPIVLTVLDHDDLRGRLRVDPKGRTERGDAVALARLLAEPPSENPHSST
jgi:hypothetical protein